MDMTAEEAIEREFPNLKLGVYQITSPQTRQYNCIAWAAGRNDKWWWPVKAYWPGRGKADEGLDSFVKQFADLGYRLCDNEDFEDGIEKVAIFVSSEGLVTHMARQLPDGRWTSKLGNGCDIAHNLVGVCGDRYGEVARILSRARS